MEELNRSEGRHHTNVSPKQGNPYCTIKRCRDDSYAQGPCTYGQQWYLPGTLYLPVNPPVNPLRMLDHPTVLSSLFVSSGSPMSGFKPTPEQFRIDQNVSLSRFSSGSEPCRISVITVLYPSISG